MRSAALLATAVVALLSCSNPAQRRATLSFFFDGVPETDDEPAGTAAGRCIAHKVAVQSATREEPKADPFAHVPFRDGRCNECHDRLLRPMKSSSDLCLTCHSREKIVPKNAHAPVGDGDCSVCHQPHTGTEPKLLRAATEALCTGCHETGDPASEARHRLLGKRRTCTNCHEAHGSSGPAFLKPPSTQLCGGCHILEFAKKTDLHSPAEGGECYACHTQHGSGQPKLVAGPIEALCFGCHDEKEVRSRPAHAKMNGARCTKCHDPHGSGQRFLLRPAAAGGGRKVGAAGNRKGAR
ncbi:MAG: hypothetical protein HY902_08540 [Deltaproteobacteria bacterium]|nr:hypothetical protein [Deltaproteobacteria bacterium]